MVTLVVVIIVIALVFDFLNGFHDAANSIATIVSTRVLSPRTAVIWAAFFNFVAALVFDVHIAKTIGQGLINIAVVNEWVILSGLLGAIAWNLITWFYGIPSSSSHALMGGYAGAAVAKAGLGSIFYANWVTTLLFIVLAPAIGMILGYWLQVAVLWFVRRKSSSKVDHVFRRLQLLSAALYSLGHGTNDAQKTMGIITLALVTGKLLPVFEVPILVILLCAGMIALGTALGGWRLIRTLGAKFYKIRPLDGFNSQLASAIVILGSSFLGGPVSTTQVVSTSIMGVGAAERLNKVRWGVGGEIAMAWLLTIPATGLVAAGIYWIAVHILP